ncbi:MAG: DUF4388 domain-containing protein [Deltaproteobacteria bacterium]|nr:DUF4388 domain-containing protein [Deltaproteobacteria bacterium]
MLEVSLRKAGFTVTTAETVQDALEKLEVHQPDLIVSETTFPDGDGFELRRRVRATPDWGEIPFIFLTAEQAIENKIRGLELGVDDYLTKPIYIKEIITRINILLQKRQRARFEERRDGRTRFAGRVSDMPVVDVIQTIEISRKSGVIQFIGERNKQATIYFRDGRVIDAESGALQGEDAVYRLLTWSEGEFEVVFRTVRRREVIQTSSQGLLMEGMRRLDEWSRILEQLPPLTHRFEVDTGELAARLGDVPDDNNRILRLIDGKRTLLEVIDASDVGDLECLQAIARLYFEEIMIDLDQSSGTPRRESGRHHVAFGDSDAPTPIEEVASGPVTAAHLDDVEAEAKAAKAKQAREARWARQAQEALETAAAPPPDVELQLVSEPNPTDAAASGPTELPLLETQPTEIEDVISEDDVLTDEVAEPGPLMGGYRPSSLRLIDEAVAAAQAIEPSLFAGINDLEDAPPDDTNPVPQEIKLDEPSAPPPKKPALKPGAQPRAPRQMADLPPLTSDDSGLRMIGSLGRDRAETSGELRPSGGVAAMPSPGTQRELITILPRRITREFPTIPGEPAATPGEPAESTPVSAPVETPSSEQVTPVYGSARPTPDPRASRELRETPPVRRGPGAGTLVVIGIAVLLTVIAVYLKVRKRPVATHVPLAVVVDAGSPIIASLAPSQPDAPSAIDAGVVDAAPQLRIDAGVPVAPDAAVSDAGVVLSRKDQAKVLYDAARAALDDSKFTAALDLIEQSLKQHRTGRGFLVKATVLQRLERVDEAVAALDAAIAIVAQTAGDYPQAWEQKGWLLWTAKRRDEAIAAFEHYLELVPNGANSTKIRAMIEKPR